MHWRARGQADRALGSGRNGGEAGERRLEARGRSAARLPPALSRCPRTCPRPGHAGLGREAGVARARERRGRRGAKGWAGPTVSNRFKSIETVSNRFEWFQKVSSGLQPLKNRFNRFQTVSNGFKRFETV